MSVNSYILQPLGGSLGDLLIQLLGDPAYNRCVIVVAWAKQSAVIRLAKAIRGFMLRGGELSIYVGIDMQGTSYEALLSLLELSTQLHVIHSRDGAQTYHPKLFYFAGSHRATSIVGSNNLTVGGLWKNVEMSGVTSYCLADSSDLDAARRLESQINELVNESPLRPKFIRTISDIDALRNAGYVDSEVKMRLKRAGALRDGTQTGGTQSEATTWFRGTLPTFVPKTQHTDGVLRLTEEYSGSNSAGRTIEASAEPFDVLWFEARNLTGGSANQIDLSMTARIIYGDPSGTVFDLHEPGRMRGGVAFFGIDPSDVTVEKDIEVSYEGHTFRNNRLYMPSGSKRDNGTWRLQLNGLDPESGVAFTKYIPARFLQQKILAFERISNDQYALSVFPGTDLDEFIANSTLVAKNGSGYGNAKYLGML